MSLLSALKAMLPQKGAEPILPTIPLPHWWSHLHVGQWVMHGNQIAKILAWDETGLLSTEVHEQAGSEFTGVTYLSQVPIRSARMATSPEIPAQFRHEARTPDKWNTTNPNHLF